MTRSLQIGLLAASLLLPSLAIAQDDPPELTGSVPFNVTSKSGRLERLAVTIGDGGTGPYKAVLWGEPTLPTHAIYRPRDLRPFGGQNLLPIVAFGNGGCRNTSGEFRNFLSEIASQGFLVVAIRPPTVPEGTARLRIAFTAGHGFEDVERLAQAVRPFLRRAAA